MVNPKKNKNWYLEVMDCAKDIEDTCFLVFEFHDFRELGAVSEKFLGLAFLRKSISKICSTGVLKNGCCGETLQGPFDVLKVLVFKKKLGKAKLGITISVEKFFQQYRKTSQAGLFCHPAKFRTP